MADDFDLEELVRLEQTFYDAGYADGFAHGRTHGLVQGRALGREKGFEIWEEIGFYQGFASTWEGICARRGRNDQRVLHHIKRLLDLARQFPIVNPSGTGLGPDQALDVVKLQCQIRSRYKALCALLGVRPSLRAGVGNEPETGDERQEQGNVSPPRSVDGTNRHPQRVRASKGDVWTIETAQGLSF